MLKKCCGGDQCTVQTSNINSPMLNVSPLAMLVPQLIIIFRNPTQSGQSYTKMHLVNKWHTEVMRVAQGNSG